MHNPLKQNPAILHYYVLYNSKKADSSDLAAIRQYAGRLEQSGEVVLKDTFAYKTAVQVYE